MREGERHRPGPSYRSHAAGFGVARVSFEPRDHRVQARLACRQADALHQSADEVRRDAEGGRRRLAVYRGENDGEYRGDGGRLSSIEIGVEVHLAISHFGHDVDTGLALGDGERAAIDILEALWK